MATTSVATPVHDLANEQEISLSSNNIRDNRARGFLSAIEDPRDSLPPTDVVGERQRISARLVSAPSRSSWVVVCRDPLVTRRRPTPVARTIEQALRSRLKSLDVRAFTKGSAGTVSNLASAAAARFTFTSESLIAAARASAARAQGGTDFLVMEFLESETSALNARRVPHVV